MKYRKKIIFCTFLICFLASCTPLMKPVTDPDSPIDSSLYSILPPVGQNWLYGQNAIPGGHEIIFGKRIGSSTHTHIANVTEIHHSADFKNQDEFMKFVDNALLFNTDPRRFKLLNEVKTPDEKFGKYCLLVSAEAEDNVLTNYNGPLLVMRIYGYYFVHPYKKDVFMTVAYSERATKDLLSENYEQLANGFIDGFKLKKK